MLTDSLICELSCIDGSNCEVKASIQYMHLLQEKSPSQTIEVSIVELQSDFPKKVYQILFAQGIKEKPVPLVSR